MAKLPVKNDAEHATALAEFSCPHLGETGCQVYVESPLICRLFGITPRLARPTVMVAPRIKQLICPYSDATRQVLA